MSARVCRWVVNAYLTRSNLPPELLTSREHEILQRIAKGKMTKEIVWRLGLSVNTAESRRIHLMRQLDIHDTATRMRYASRRGLTSP